MLSQEEYKDYCRRFGLVWKYIKSHSHPQELVLESLCSERGYDLARMSGILREAEVCFVDPDQFDFSAIKGLDKGDLGICTASGSFLLLGRFIVPVKDMLGNVIALIGWFKQEDKKYVTTPSRLFSKECLFFGMEQFKSGMGKRFIIVEGIFDSLSVRSLGMRCLSMMGINSSRYKCELYNLMGDIVAVPDNDKEGRKVVSEDSWLLPKRGKYMTWSGLKDVKDIDDLVKCFDPVEVHDLLSDVFSEPDRIVNVKFN